MPSLSREEAAQDARCAGTWSQTILGDATVLPVWGAGKNMGIDEMKDGTIRVYGSGRDEVRIGLTVGKQQMFLGLQGRQGKIGCVDIGKRDARILAKKVAAMHSCMRDFDESVEDDQ